MSTTTLAEDSAAKAAAAMKPEERPKMRLRTKILLIFFSLLLMAILRTGFVFFIIGVLPSIVAYYTDVSKHRYTFKSIFACNLSGMLPFLGKMMMHGPSSSLLQEIMSRGTNWLIIYASAMLGWLLVQVCPMIAQIMIVGLHQTQVARMKRVQEKIEGEWGPEVAQFSYSADPNEVHY